MKVSCCKCGLSLGEIRDATLRKGWSILCAMCRPYKPGPQKTESDVVNDLMSMISGQGGGHKR